MQHKNHKVLFIRQTLRQKNGFRISQKKMCCMNI